MSGMSRFEHGGDIYAHEGVLDFSANVNPLGMPPTAVRALRESVSEFSAYPDPSCRALTDALCAAEGVASGQLVCTAGASDLIARVCAVVRPKKALVCAPCYSGYEQALEQTGAQVVRHLLREEDGFALTGSFCTFHQVIEQMEAVAAHPDWQVIPILSPNAYETDTRFGKAADFREQIERICGHEIWHTIAQTEPIGPKKLLDVLLVAPCTGNTLGKLANGITDTSVTMAVKAHLRNARPVVLAVSTNDALANAGKNIGLLFNSKNIYFVPMRQDNAAGKPTSVVADFTQIVPAVEAALQARQVQPLFC